MTWQEFQDSLNQRYGATNFQYLFGELIKSVSEYQTQFKSNGNWVPDIAVKNYP